MKVFFFFSIVQSYVFIKIYFGLEVVGLFLQNDDGFYCGGSLQSLVVFFISF